MLQRTRFGRVLVCNAAVALAAAAFSCAAPATMTAERSFGRTTLLRVGDEPIGIGLGQRCAALGLETCFNARDDNCNGLVDEGCGVPTGLLQVMIAWDDAEADVDLEVIGPNGEPARVGQTTALGLTKDRDCPGENGDCGGQNVEVVTLPGDSLPNGRYEVTVRLERAAKGSGEVNVRLGGHIGQDGLSGQVVLTAEKPRVSVQFARSNPESG